MEKICSFDGREKPSTSQTQTSAHHCFKFLFQINLIILREAILTRSEYSKIGNYENSSANHRKLVLSGSAELVSRATLRRFPLDIRQGQGPENWASSSFSACTVTLRKKNCSELQTKHLLLAVCVPAALQHRDKEAIRTTFLHYISYFARQYSRGSVSPLLQAGKMLNKYF